VLGEQPAALDLPSAALAVVGRDAGPVAPGAGPERPADDGRCCFLRSSRSALATTSREGGVATCLWYASSDSISLAVQRLCRSRQTPAKRLLRNSRAKVIVKQSYEQL